MMLIMTLIVKITSKENWLREFFFFFKFGSIMPRCLRSTTVTPKLSHIFSMKSGHRGPVIYSYVCVYVRLFLSQLTKNTLLDHI